MFPLNKKPISSLWSDYPWGVLISGVNEVFVKGNHLTFPQALQWWRLQVRVNSQVQIMHIVALRSGIHIGALDPSWAPLSGTSWVAWKILQGDNKIAHMKHYDDEVYDLNSVTGHFNQLVYHLRVSNWGECGLFLGVIVDCGGNGLNPLISTCSRALRIKPQLWVYRSEKKHIQLYELQGFHRLQIVWISCYRAWNKCQWWIIKEVEHRVYFFFQFTKNGNLFSLL